MDARVVGRRGLATRQSRWQGQSKGYFWECEQIMRGQPSAVGEKTDVLLQVLLELVTPGKKFSSTIFSCKIAYFEIFRPLKEKKGVVFRRKTFYN